MKNYTTLTAQLKRKIMNYSKKIVNSLGKVQIKFIISMIYGLLRGQSVKLTEIARSLEEDIKVIDTVDRLSKNLMSFNDEDIIYDNYINEIKGHIDDDTVFCVDETELIKPHGSKFEALGTVIDSSSKDKRIEKGYKVCEIAALTKNRKQPVSVYSHIYSNKENGFKSANHENIKALDTVVEKFNGRGTFVFDRWYDANQYFQYGSKKNINYIIRVKKNRNIRFQNKEINVDDFAKKRKGKIRMDIRYKNRVHNCKIGYTKINIPCLKEPLYLVVVYGSQLLPLKLLTNRDLHNKSEVRKVVAMYLKRWRIEEYFKFKKQQFKFEDIRVRRLTSIRTLNTILMIATGLIGIITEQDTMLTSEIISHAKGIKKKIFFLSYRICDGIYRILKYSSKGIQDLIKREMKTRNIPNLFSINGIEVPG